MRTVSELRIDRYSKNAAAADAQVCVSVCESRMTQNASTVGTPRERER